MEIAGEESMFSIPVGSPIPYGEKSQLIELSPSSFNAGNSLAGRYYLEIAAYNSRKKQILSSFKRLPKYILISSEEKVFIESCLGHNT